MKRPQEQLLAMAHHLSYEVEMLIVSGMLAQAPAEGADQIVRRNCFLEAFALHARALRDVFCQQSERSDDVSAGDFLPDGQTWDQQQPAELAGLKWRTGKEIAHLTWSRLEVDPSAKGWKIGGILIALLALLDRFLAVASPQALGPYKERMEGLLDYYRREGSLRRMAWLLAFPGGGAPSTASATATMSIGGRALDLSPPVPVKPGDPLERDP